MRGTHVLMVVLVDSIHSTPVFSDHQINDYGINFSKRFPILTQGLP